MQPLTWDDNVVCAGARVLCRACAAAMDVRLEGEWRHLKSKAARESLLSCPSQRRCCYRAGASREAEPARMRRIRA